MQFSQAVHLSDEIGRIRELTRQRRHAAALTAAMDLSSKEPANADALYLLAANQRCLNLVADALATLTRLERMQPSLSRLHQERGFCFLATRNSAQAIAALRQGVTLNPALLASWSALEGLYRVIGDSENAAAAREQVARLRQLPAEVVQAGSLFFEGEFAAAETLLHTHMENGSHIEALRLLARIKQQRGALHEAENLLHSVIERAPDYGSARADYAAVLLGRQKYFEARAESFALLQLEPANAYFRSLHATACAGLCDHEAAIAAYRRILDAEPTLAHVQVLLGHSLKASGRQQEAVVAYHAAKDARPAFGDAYWSLANLKTYRFSDSDIARMQGAAAGPGAATVDRIHLHFALGQALEGRGRYQDSWRHYEQGNALKRAESGYRPELAEIDTEKQIVVCTPQFFAERALIGAPAPDPIFIVGLPRSGSTLIEQILASHSQVEGTQELNIIPRIVEELPRNSEPGCPGYPDALLELAPEQFHNLGKRYLIEAGAFRKVDCGAGFFTDKLPHNFRHLGLIHVMLPNAKIIDVRRDPIACCFSNFKQLYAGGNEFSYDLQSTARYYRAYLHLMDHWDRVLPGRVHRIIYEELIENPQDVVRLLLDFCGLKFEPACIEFHKTARSIATASSEQVRQPLNRESLDRWTHYRPWLMPLESSLGDARLRYNAPR
jgi:tetratricopeptide (TPR) repeat protein